ncbi:MAG: pyrroline-5-carboxylate reductase [Deltaproteobacteria bacterium]|nr:pyrroline-5-carboxylate reductase [Deltaproteobacteria bacterium]
MKTPGELPPCDFYLIACKPQQFSELAKNLNSIINPQGVVISIMAGVTTTKIKSLLPRAEKIVRTMPNLPCLVGEGVTGMYVTPAVSPEERNIVQGIFETVSKTFLFESESALDIVVAVTGSGPAYVFEWANLLIHKMTAMGMDAKTADGMVRQLFVGASRLMAESPDSPEELGKRVTSKGGTTEAALKVFSESKLDAIVSKAIDAAFNRAKELSKL